jgi:hypothetical protein
MGKNPNTFQKRQREMEKKRKQEDKRKKRIAQKNDPTPRDTVVEPEIDPQSDAIE